MRRIYFILLFVLVEFCALKGLLPLREMVERFGRIESRAPRNRVLYPPGRVHFNPCSDLLNAKLDQRNWSAFHRREHGKSSSEQNTMLSGQLSFFIRFAFFYRNEFGWFIPGKLFKREHIKQLLLVWSNQFALQELHFISSSWHYVT